MTGNLEQAITALLQGALPALSDGDPPSVGLSVTATRFDGDDRGADGGASEPRPDDRTDRFDFDPDAPPADFTLSQTPYPGPRRVRLTTADGSKLSLHASEVAWNETDPRVFTLQLNPSRDLSEASGVEVLYGVVSVFTKLKLVHVLAIELTTSDATTLAVNGALAVAAIELHRQALIDGSAATHSAGNLSAGLQVTSLALVAGERLAADRYQLRYRAEVELKAMRSLEENEGAPIERIRTTSQPLRPQLHVDVAIDVDA